MVCCAVPLRCGVLERACAGRAVCACGSYFGVVPWWLAASACLEFITLLRIGVLLSVPGVTGTPGWRAVQACLAYATQVWRAVRVCLEPSCLLRCGVLFERA